MPTDDKPIIAPNYSKEEQDFRSDLIKRLIKSRDERNMAHDEFDGMTYPQYYESNKKADLAYVAPKKNKQDVRISSGITMEADNTLLSSLLNFTYTGKVTAKNKNNLVIADIGNDMADLVKASKDTEQYGDKRNLIYREFISQGDVFVEEYYSQEYRDDVLDKNVWKPTMKISEGSKFEYGRQICDEKPAVRLLCGLNVYLGDFREMEYEKQDLIFTYEVLNYDFAKTMWGKWDRWENVPKNVSQNDINNYIAGQNPSTNWNLFAEAEGKVGVLKIQMKSNNRYMLMLNGVMMLPIQYPLTAISATGGFTVTQGKFQPIQGCAYSKGQPSKTKLQQQVVDEFQRVMVLKNRQSLMPTLGNITKKVMSDDIYTAGKIIPDVRPDQLFPIHKENRGITSGEFSMYQLLKEEIEAKSINATYAGNEQGGQKTATQILQEKNAQLLKLGLAFDGIQLLEKNLVWLRIFTILQRYGEPTDLEYDENEEIDNIYRIITAETTLDTGEKGMKIFRFTDKAFPKVRDQQKEEKKLGKEYGKKVKISYINAYQFTQLRAKWEVQIIATEKNSDLVDRMLFMQYVSEAINLFGIESLNMEHIKQRYAVMIGEDFNKFFKEISVQEMLMNKMQPIPSQVNSNQNKPQLNIKPQINA